MKAPLLLLAGALGACSSVATVPMGSGGDETTVQPGGSGAATGGMRAGGDAGEQGNAGAGGDTPWAAVRAVVVSGEAGSYTFAVSVESQDLDCSQFANWWEVLRSDGQLVYRRILDHSHTDENGTTDAGAPGNTFTRSGGPISIDPEEQVYVRAHMSTGGYRGDVFGGSVSAGFQVARGLSEGFAAELEFAEPQPMDCLF